MGPVLGTRAMATTGKVLGAVLVGVEMAGMTDAHAAAAGMVVPQIPTKRMGQVAVVVPVECASGRMRGRVGKEGKTTSRRKKTACRGKALLRLFLAQ